MYFNDKSQTQIYFPFIFFRAALPENLLYYVQLVKTQICLCGSYEDSMDTRHSKAEMMAPITMCRKTDKLISLMVGDFLVMCLLRFICDVIYTLP